MGLITDATDQDLENTRRAIVAEQERRRTLASAGRQMDDLAKAVLSAQGMRAGDAWVQPTDATNAYPKDWETVHDGKEWVSLVSGNVWEPGVSAWREKATGGSVPEFVQPTGAHDAYQTGDHVMFEGTEYVSKIDSNTWSPSGYPAGWQKVEE